MSPGSNWWGPTVLQLIVTDSSEVLHGAAVLDAEPLPRAPRVRPGQLGDQG
jgi:hypothetical protein